MQNPTGGGSTTFDHLLSGINNQIVTPLIYLLATLAVVYFMMGVFTFIRNADAPDKRQEGFQHMVWGVIGIFIMVSAKGLINLLLVFMGLK